MSTSVASVRTYNLALMGFGGVNRALAELIRDRSTGLEQQLGFPLRIVAITDLLLGSWGDADGMDPAVALAVLRGANFPGGFAGTDNEYIIKNSNADIVVEATFTDPVDGEPATSHVRWALESGKHVTTTNKGPVALHSQELLALADKSNVQLEFEGSVLSGTPILRFADQNLRGLTVTGFEGSLNGTSNFVLGRMENGHARDQAIAEAQQLGYAEADPSADIDGSDVRLKVVILANQVLCSTDPSLTTSVKSELSGPCSLGRQSCPSRSSTWRRATRGRNRRVYAIGGQDVADHVRGRDIRQPGSARPGLSASRRCCRGVQSPDIRSRRPRAGR